MAADRDQTIKYAPPPASERVAPEFVAAEISVVERKGAYAAVRDQTINYAPSPELIAALTRPLEKLNKDQRKEIQTCATAPEPATASCIALRRS